MPCKALKTSSSCRKLVVWFFWLKQPLWGPPRPCVASESPPEHSYVWIWRVGYGENPPFWAPPRLRANACSLGRPQKSLWTRLGFGGWGMDKICGQNYPNFFLPTRVLGTKSSWIKRGLHRQNKWSLFCSVLAQVRIFLFVSSVSGILQYWGWDGEHSQGNIQYMHQSQLMCSCRWISLPIICKLSNDKLLLIA